MSFSFTQGPLEAGVSGYIFEEGGEVTERYPVNLLVIDPASGSPQVQVLLIAKLEGKSLVALPRTVWHRTVARRVLPPPGLSKPTMVEVPAVRHDTMLTVSDMYIKVWIGFLPQPHLDNIHVGLEEMDCDYFFDVEEGHLMLPFAHSLVQVAQEHFAFFSAEEGQDAQEHEEAAEEEVPEESGWGDQPGAARIDKLEEMMETLTLSVADIAKKLKLKGASGASPSTAPATTRPSALRTSNALGGGSKRGPQQNRVAFPSLDQGVVQAALKAGIPQENLAQMEKLISQNVKAKKTPDLSAQVLMDPLSEDEDLEALPEQAAEDGGEEGASPMERAMTKMANIMELLADDKKKKASRSKLDQALESAGGGGSAESSLSHGGRKAAAQRRALRATFQEHPQEIYQTVERLIAEDLNSQTLAPGMPAQAFNARAWVEFRSRIGNYKAAAFGAWSAAGILDALVDGDTARARARAALLLLVFDQAAVDRGSYVLAGEMTLEGLPPFSALGSHNAPSLADGEQPFSKILDPRWGDICLSHLKEQDDYVQRRSNIGKYQKKGDKDSHDPPDAEAKRRAKPKPKPKPQGGAAAPE